MNTGLNIPSHPSGYSDYIEKYRKEHNKEMRSSRREEPGRRHKSRSKRVRVEVSDDSIEDKIYDKRNGGSIYSVRKPPALNPKKRSDIQNTPEKFHSQKFRDSGVWDTHWSTLNNSNGYSRTKLPHNSTEGKGFRAKMREFPGCELSFNLPE